MTRPVPSAPPVARVLNALAAAALAGGCAALGVVACAEDGLPADPGAADAGVADASPDALAGESLCGADLLEATRAAAGFDALVFLTFSSAGDCTPVEATRRSAGTPCATARDVAACRAAFDAPAPCSTERDRRGALLVASRGDQVVRVPFAFEVLREQDVRTFFVPEDPYEAFKALGPVAGPADAALRVALARGATPDYTCRPAEVCRAGSRDVVASSRDGSVVVETLAAPSQDCPAENQKLVRSTFVFSPEGSVAATEATVAEGCTMRIFCGRAYEGEPDVAPGTTPATRLARAAYYEAGSVTSFRRLARELRAHGAPSSLVARARSAARDEVRHARATEALATRFGAGAPMRPRAGALPVRPLEAMARENAVEGCVNEAFAAALALVQASRAADAGVRGALAGIAADEVRHAELAWDVAAWAEAQLDAAARTRVQTARDEALAALVTSGAREGAEDLPSRRLLGLPSPREAAALARGAAAALAALHPAAAPAPRAA